MPRLVCAVSLVAAVVLAGCGGAATPSPAASVAPSAAPSSAAASQPSGPSAPSSTACAPGAAGAAADVSVTIAGFAYSPQTVEAKVGQVIGWKNDDSAPHTATLEDDSCTTATIATGATGLLVFSVAGTYTYKCAIHPARMKGFKIVIT